MLCQRRHTRSEIKILTNADTFSYTQQTCVNNPYLERRENTTDTSGF